MIRAFDTFSLPLLRWLDAEDAHRLAVQGLRLLPPLKPRTDDSKLAVELNFKHIDDFEPAKVAEQIPALRELLEMRQKLSQLLSKMEGNDKLEALLAEVLTNTDKARDLAKELGISPESPEASK